MGVLKTYLLCSYIGNRNPLHELCICNIYQHRNDQQVSSWIFIGFISWSLMLQLKVLNNYFGALICIWCPYCLAWQHCLHQSPISYYSESHLTVLMYMSYMWYISMQAISAVVQRGPISYWRSRQIIISLLISSAVFTGDHRVIRFFNKSKFVVIELYFDMIKPGIDVICYI